MTESDTPETDALAKGERHHTVAETRYWCREYKEHARSLERRLAQSQEENIALKATLAAHGHAPSTPETRAMEKDAARYWFIRNLLAIEDVERLVADGNPTPDEQESLRTDDAIDAALKSRP